MPVDLGLPGVEEEAVPEHLPEVGQEGPDAAVLVVVLVVKALLDDVQCDGVLNLLQVLGEVQVRTVPASRVGGTGKI